MATAPKLEALLAIGKLIAPGAKSLPGEVTLAFEDPAAYAKKFAKRMKARSITKPPKNLPWIALIDALQDAGALAELDHRAETADVKRGIDGLAGLPKSKERWKWLKALSEEEQEDLDLAELLEHAGAHLGEEGFLLAQLDMDSDAFPVVVVPQRDAKQLVSLGKAAGYGDVDLFTGSDLAEMQRERKEREANRAAAAAAAPARPAVNWRSFIREGDGQTLAWSVLPVGSQVDHYASTLGHPMVKTSATLSSPAAAASEVERLIGERISEGYHEIPLAEFRARNTAEEARLAAAAKTAAKGKAKSDAGKPKPKRKK